jgi:hypothetical protein
MLHAGREIICDAVAGEFVPAHAGRAGRRESRSGFRQWRIRRGSCVAARSRIRPRSDRGSIGRGCRRSRPTSCSRNGCAQIPRIMRDQLGRPTGSYRRSPSLWSAPPHHRAARRSGYARPHRDLQTESAHDSAHRTANMRPRRAPVYRLRARSAHASLLLLMSQSVLRDRAAARLRCQDASIPAAAIRAPPAPARPPAKPGSAFPPDGSALPER